MVYLLRKALCREQAPAEKGTCCFSDLIRIGKWTKKSWQISRINCKTRERFLTCLTGLMGWDTGHRWLLLVRNEDKIFSLFDDWVQYGQIEFCVVAFNKSQIVSLKDEDLETHIYVMRNGQYTGILVDKKEFNKPKSELLTCLLFFSYLDILNRNLACHKK